MTQTESDLPPLQALDDLDSTGNSFRKCLHELQAICHLKKKLPTTFELAGVRLVPNKDRAYGGFSDTFEGTLGRDVCIKQLRISSSGDREKVQKVLHLLNLRLDGHLLTNPKLFCKEAIVWKRLNHPNIVPFKGVTLDPLQLISEWMPGGELREYIRTNKRANRIGLVCPFLPTPKLYLTLSSVAGHR